MTATTLTTEMLAMLSKINDNISDVKERLTRLESQNFSENIMLVNQRMDREREARMALEARFEKLERRMAPFILGASILVVVIVDVAFRSIF